MSIVEEHTPDIIVSGGGSVYLFEPLTEVGMHWIEENAEAEDWQWFGNALCVEHGYVDDIIVAMEGDDLEVEIAGQREREAAIALKERW